jgi:hypothetical protein
MTSKSVKSPSLSVSADVERFDSSEGSYWTSGENFDICHGKGVTPWQAPHLKAAPQKVLCDA